jgi:hypothetical protein
MENQTRYDLNAAIENWRQELASQPNLAAEDRRELETHLRDSIAGFKQKGLNDEESFWCARRRFGQPQQVGEEFFKADPAKIWRDRVFWVVWFLFVLLIMQSFTWFLGILFPGERWSRVLNYTFYSILLLIPTCLSAGLMTRQFSKLLQLINGRFRLACATSILILTSLVLRYAEPILFWENQKAVVKAYNLIGAKTGEYMSLGQQHYSSCTISQLLTQGVPLCILALLLILLTPAQKRTTPQGTRT